MSSGSHPAILCVEASGVLFSAPSLSFRNITRLVAVTLTAAALAACAQSSVNTSKSDLPSAGRQASLLTFKKINQDAFGANARSAPQASSGLASYYAEGSRTASGEKLDPNKLTAAHPSLPFGTRLRITRVDTGRSVIVRVNDRGPFVKGRVVDVSYSAAEKLGITEQGVAKVKVDVVQ